MASDLLNIGSQSVLTNQKQLNTTGHNISNVNTKGYSRQSIVQGTNDPRMYGGATYGMGVHVDNVRRSWDQFAVKELNLTTTNHARNTDDEMNIEMLSSMLSSAASKKIPENLNDWFDAVTSLSDNPNDMGAREVVLDESKVLSETLNDFHETIREQSDIVNKKLDMGIIRINQLAYEIRDIHRLMMRTEGPHIDLLDQHEKLINELSEYTKVSVTTRENPKGFDVHIGHGHTLVSGTEASQLKMIDGFPDIHQHRLAMIEGKGIKAIKSEGMDGKIGALFKMRDEHLPHMMDELGRMTIAFSGWVNYLQFQGLDLNGEVGQPIFSQVNGEKLSKSRVIQSSKSEADIAVKIANLTQLKGGQYRMRYDGSDYIVTKPDGKTVIMETRNDAFELDGMRVEINNEPEEGELILLRPTRLGASQIQLEISDPKSITAQSFEASTTFAQGDADFRIRAAGDLREFEVIVSPLGNQFAVTDTKGNIVLAPQPYPPEELVEVVLSSDHPDYKDGDPTIFELSGGALPDDKFTANLTPSEGDNGNLRKMLKIQTEKRMDGNDATVLNVYQNLNTSVGLKNATASRMTEVSRLEKETAQERVASISGVNLDEEAANMMKFQQAYMASSRIMQASNDTFNTILALR